MSKLKQDNSVWLEPTTEMTYSVQDNGTVVIHIGGHMGLALFFSDGDKPEQGMAYLAQILLSARAARMAWEQKDTLTVAESQALRAKEANNGG